MEQHKGLVDLKLVSKYFPDSSFSCPRPGSEHYHHHHQEPSRSRHDHSDSRSSSVMSVPSLVDDRSSTHSSEEDQQYHVTASGLWDSFWQPGQSRGVTPTSSSRNLYPAMIPLRETPPRKGAVPEDDEKESPSSRDVTAANSRHNSTGSEETLLQQSRTLSPIKRKPVAMHSKPPARGSYSLFPPPSPPRQVAVVPPRSASLAKPLPPTPLLVQPIKAPLAAISEAPRTAVGTSVRSDKKSSVVLERTPSKSTSTAKSSPISPAFQPPVPSPMNHSHPAMHPSQAAAAPRRPSLPIFRPAMPMRARSSSDVTAHALRQGRPEQPGSGSNTNTNSRNNSRPNTPITSPPVLTNPFERVSVYTAPRAAPPPPPPKSYHHLQQAVPYSPPASPFSPTGIPSGIPPSTPSPRVFIPPLPMDLPTPPSPPSPRSLVHGGPAPPPLMTPALPYLSSPPSLPHQPLQQGEEIPVSYFDDSDDDEDEEEGLTLWRIARTLGLPHKQKNSSSSNNTSHSSSTNTNSSGGGKRRNYVRNDSTSSASTANTSFTSSFGSSSAASSRSSSDGATITPTTTCNSSRGTSWEQQQYGPGGRGGSEQMELREALMMLSPEDCQPAPRPAPRVRRQRSEVFTRMLGLRH
ncbi:hypothetical protein NKR23_g1782 [Pleurostoma richardsiae]|uniref:Uncharacterized protein n=1 Tax=Pleurostoma richardsiae TaxID=41990 RepID=A0AA38VNW3_9PEZI|nr:hypothetical protein NKR23_g1782 [Pleurostoma richardsiae]